MPGRGTEIKERVQRRNIGKLVLLNKARHVKGKKGIRPMQARKYENSMTEGKKA